MKDKLEFKKLLLRNKKRVFRKDLKYECCRCKEDVRISSTRSNVIYEDNETVSWRFICSCGQIKVITYESYEKLGESYKL